MCPAPAACSSPCALPPAQCRLALICRARFRRARWLRGHIQPGRGGLRARRWSSALAVSWCHVVSGAGRTLESYLRDMIAAYSLDGDNVKCVKKTTAECERVWRGAGVVLVRSSSRHKLPRVGVSKPWHRPLFDGGASHREQVCRAASPRALYRQPRHRSLK
jgi:hypothetical protein